MAHVRHRARVLMASAVTSLMFLGGAQDALARPRTESSATPPPVTDLGAQYVANDEIRTRGGMSKSAVQNLAAQRPGSVLAAPEFAGPWFTFATTSRCNDAPPGPRSTDNFCDRATIPCEGNTDPEGLGPAVNIWAARVDQADNPVDLAGNQIPAPVWVLRGYTCFPNYVPGAAPTLTMAQVIEQFRDTAFAKAIAAVQPVKGTTLVNLPTYYELQWPAEGFQPDEVDTTTLVGHRVQIKPTFQSATYVYGDGATSGPVATLGGPYPIGDVVHTYGQPADVQVRIDVTYGGQFSVDGGDWIDIPGTATVEGTPFALRVAEAHAQLVTR